jgi:hypothetical protein
MAALRLDMELQLPKWAPKNKMKEALNAKDEDGLTMILFEHNDEMISERIAAVAIKTYAAKTGANLMDYGSNAIN